MQHKCVGLGAVGILTLSFIQNVDLLDQFSVFIAQKLPLRAQSGSKGSLYNQRIGTNGCQFAIVNGKFTLKLYKL